MGLELQCPMEVSDKKRGMCRKGTFAGSEGDGEVNQRQDRLQRGTSRKEVRRVGSRGERGEEVKRRVGFRQVSTVHDTEI